MIYRKNLINACVVYILRQKLFLQLFHFKWDYLLIFFSFTLSEKEKHCSWMHFNCEGIKARDLLVWNLFKILKNSISSNYYFPSMVYIGYYRNMIIEFTAAISNYFINCKLAFCLFECWVTDSLSWTSDKIFWCTLSIMTHNTCCLKTLIS